MERSDKIRIFLNYFLLSLIDVCRVVYMWGHYIMHKPLSSSQSGWSHLIKSVWRYEAHQYVCVSAVVSCGVIVRVRWSRLPWWSPKDRRSTMKACWSTWRTLSARAVSKNPSTSCAVGWSYWTSSEERRYVIMGSGDVHLQVSWAGSCTPVSHRRFFFPPLTFLLQTFWNRRKKSPSNSFLYYPFFKPHIPAYVSRCKAHVIAHVILL